MTDQGRSALAERLGEVPLLGVALGDGYGTAAAILGEHGLFIADVRAPEVTAAFAKALHEACLRDWAARPAGSMMTVHGVDAHNERASDIATSLLGAP